MRLFDPEDPRPIHFMGIAGAGMSALALVARRRGVAVSGCDLNLRDASDVAEAGATVSVGHDPSHVTAARALVRSSAVPDDHPEVVAALKHGIPVVRRAEALGALVGESDLIGVAGTHGKTTTTTMTAEVLTAAGFDPTALVGGRVERWNGNARLGGERLFVVEADEYDRSFLALRPTVAIINNVEADHLECYGTTDALEDAFVTFGEPARLAIVPGDDPGASRVADRLSNEVWRVGFDDLADVRIADVRYDDDGTTARVSLPREGAVTIRLAIPGEHNLRNAVSSLCVAHALGGDLQAAAAALERFDGVGRRFEILAASPDVTVVDDYAHHHTEVRATIEAARQRFPRRRLVVVFQPHLFSRTRDFGAQLGEALVAADLAFVLPVYPARERPIPGVTGQTIVDAAVEAGGQTRWVDSDVFATVCQEVRTGDVLLVLGAGDVTELAHALADEYRGVAA